MSDVLCPYCGSDEEINHDDGYGYEEGRKHSQECGNCGKSFAFETCISFYYEAFEAECLNDGKHNYEVTKTHPSCFAKMKCSMCDNQRELTDEERELYNIPRIEVFYESLKGKEKI